MSEVATQRSWESLAVGEITSLEKYISQEDIVAFGRLSGDMNPLHITNGVVHGMYIGALLSALVGMQLPGERALLMKESLSFKRSVRAGDTVVLIATLTHKSEATRIITLCVAVRAHNELVAEGEAHVQVRL
jgi:acyl dehydratase